MRDALSLIEAILKQNDLLAPVSDKARQEFAKYKALLMTLISAERPDRLIYAYESLTTKLFAATIVDGVRHDPIGWMNSREHLARVGEERALLLGTRMRRLADPVSLPRSASLTRLCILRTLAEPCLTLELIGRFASRSPR
jgi:hypothetical protein